MSRVSGSDAFQRFRSNPQSKQQEFKYRNIVGEDEFRLLKLHAGKNELVCSLEHHTLGAEATPPYRALSYTWDQDKPRYDIRMPGNAVFKVRKNLRDALRSLRDARSDCYVWIDAICIDQSSSEERNHQVRLMAAIYGDANVVVAWLESDSQIADIANAFEFIRAAVAYEPNHASVQRYCNQHKSKRIGNENRDWISVIGLCNIRYWSRKWVSLIQARILIWAPVCESPTERRQIIQEIITARTVVLCTKGSTLPMSDFESFLDQVGKAQFASPIADHCAQISTTPAARLAFQRLEMENEEEQGDAGLLYKLIERYATNKCHLPCDHVYALYNLAGEQRAHLTISYAASPAEQFRAVMQYVSVHEDLPPDQTGSFAELLRNLLQLRYDDAAQERRFLNGLSLMMSTTILGMAMLPECQASLRLRSLLTPLRPIPSFSLIRSQGNVDWTLRASEADIPYLVGRPDMVYFSIVGSDRVGLAGCRLEAGDQICHIPGTKLVFVARPKASDQSVCIVGRAFIFTKTAMPDDEKKCDTWLNKSLSFINIPQSQQTISLGCAKLLELVDYANDVPGPSSSGLGLVRMTEHAASSCEHQVCTHCPVAIARHWYRRSKKQKLIITGGACGAVVVALVLGITIPLTTGGGGAAAATTAATTTTTTTAASGGSSAGSGCCCCCCCCC